MSSYKQKRKWHRYWHKVNQAMKRQQRKLSLASKELCTLQPNKTDLIRLDVKVKEESFNQVKVSSPAEVEQKSEQKIQTVTENWAVNLPSLIRPSLPSIDLVNSKDEVQLNNQQDQIGPKTRFTGEELVNMDTSQNVDVVEDLVPAEEISLIAGPGDSGKSLFYQQICLSIVLGLSEFLGKKINSKHKSALIISTEDNEKRLSTRIRRQLKKLTGNCNGLKNLIIRTTGENIITLLRTELSHKKFDLVVLDALGDILLEDTNSQTAVRKFYNELEMLIREFKCSILFVHHEGKSVNRNRRSNIIGSVAIVDRARNVMMLGKDPKTGIRSLTIEKSNNISDEKKGKAIKLRLDPESLTYSLAGDYNVTVEMDSETSLAAEISKKKQSTILNSESVILKSSKNRPGRKRNEVKYNEAVKMYEEGYTQVEISEVLSVNKATVCRWLKGNNGNLKQAI